MPLNLSKIGGFNYVWLNSRGVVTLVVYLFTNWQPLAMPEILKKTGQLILCQEKKKKKIFSGRVPLRGYSLQFLWKLV